MLGNLTLGNQAFREKNYKKALECYQTVLIEQPEMESVIKANLIFTKKKLYESNLKRNEIDEIYNGEVNFDIAEDKKKVSVGIVILSLNGASLLDKLFNSINSNKPKCTFEIFVTDHGSADNTKNIINKWNKIIPIYTNFELVNHSFSFSNNQWVKKIQHCEKILFLNNDIIFNENIVDKMVLAFNDPNVGIVGVDQLDLPSENGVISWHHKGIGFKWDQEYSFWRPYNLKENNNKSCEDRRIVYAVTGSFLMIRRSDFLGLGGFDEGYNYGYEDIDLCLALRSKLKKKIICIESSNVIHADGLTRKKTPKEEIKKQRLGNIELFRKKNNSDITRNLRQSIIKNQELNQHKLKIAFAVSEIGKLASAGDLFTAMELGGAIESEFGWSIEYRPKGEQWYELSDIDIVIAMVDSYNPQLITGAHPALIKIAWARNWFERWCDRIWCTEYDLYFASSKKSSEYIYNRLGVVSHILKIGTNLTRFNIKNRSAIAADDYLFTGSYWNAERDIVAALASIPRNIRGGIYGKNWEKIPLISDLNRGFIPYDQLPDVYSKAKIVIDDANHVTKPWGSVNSRVFDALAAGCLVITNSHFTSNDIFDGELPVYDTPEQLVDLISKYSKDEYSRENLVKKLRDRVIFDHTYVRRAYEFRDNIESGLKNLLRFSIKIPVPSREVSAQWGDYHFAQSLGREIRKFGHQVRVDFLLDWSRGDSEGDDVSIVLRGLSKYITRESQHNIIWLISHPDKVEDEELNLYERVFVASETYAQKLSSRLTVPVETLLQCTDKSRFGDSSKYKENSDIKSNILFVGNSRNQFRKIIKKSIESGLKPNIYGANWEKFIDNSLIKGLNISNEDLPAYYANADVILNDHWDDMAREGFISNRLFDASACKSNIVSDHCKGMNDIFGETVHIHQTDDDISRIVNNAATSDNLLLKLKLREKILFDHSFRNRANKIISTINF